MYKIYIYIRVCLHPVLLLLVALLLLLLLLPNGFIHPHLELLLGITGRAHSLPPNLIIRKGIRLLLQPSPHPIETRDTQTNVLVELFEESRNFKIVRSSLSKEESDDVVIGDRDRRIPSAISRHRLPGILGLQKVAVTLVSVANVAKPSRRFRDLASRDDEVSLILGEGGSSIRCGRLSRAGSGRKGGRD